MNMKLILGALAGLVALLAIAFFSGLFSSGPGNETPQQVADAGSPQPAPESSSTTAPAPAAAQPETEGEPEIAEPEPTVAASAGAEPSSAASGPPGGAKRDLVWMHGNCLVSKNELTKGTELTVVTLGDPQTVIRGEVTGPVTSDEDCRLLDGLRRENNADKGDFYKVETRTAVDYAAAIVHPEGGGTAPDPTMLDVDEDEVLDTFTRCMDSEGMRFSVWAGEPYNSQELWRGTYVLEGDKMPDCPPS